MISRFKVGMVLACVLLLRLTDGSPAAQSVRPATAPASAGPAVGAVVPPFSGTDQFGRTQTLERVLGPKGAMLVFFRSADW